MCLAKWQSVFVFCSVNASDSDFPRTPRGSGPRHYCRCHRTILDTQGSSNARYLLELWYLPLARLYALCHPYFNCYGGNAPMECSKLEFLQTDTSTLNLHVLFQISLVVDMVGDMNLEFSAEVWQIMAALIFSSNVRQWKLLQTLVAFLPGHSSATRFTRWLVRGSSLISISTATWPGTHGGQASSNQLVKLQELYPWELWSSKNSSFSILKRFEQSKTYFLCWFPQVQ